MGTVEDRRQSLTTTCNVILKTTQTIKYQHRPDEHGPEAIKLFSMLNSTEHANPSHNSINARNSCFFLIVESMINTTSERLKARNFFICRYFSFYEYLKFRAQLSLA